MAEWMHLRGLAVHKIQHGSFSCRADALWLVAGRNLITHSKSDFNSLALLSQQINENGEYKFEQNNTETNQRNGWN